MEGIDLSFPSYAQHERMAAALEAIGAEMADRIRQKHLMLRADNYLTGQIQHGFSGHGIRARWQQAKQTSINCFQGLQQQQHRHGMERRTHCEAMIRQYQE